MASLVKSIGYVIGTIVGQFVDANYHSVFMAFGGIMFVGIGLLFISGIVLWLKERYALHRDKIENDLIFGKKEKVNYDTEKSYRLKM